ncbi:MAG: glycosyltransferase family 2 protein [Acidobacteriota bacterium]|nr:glycosyltransferase family 2 protein [Acidobacteriota bacterium]
MIDLSIVIPVFNERDNIEPIVIELLDVLPGFSSRFEILLVDDGSDDGSREVIDRVAAANHSVVPLHLRENRGQTAAFDAGFRKARGEWVVTMDGDMQNDPRDIGRLLDAAGDDLDAVVGYRRSREDSWHRRVLSRLANGIRNVVSGDDIIDTCCSLKAFRRKCLTVLKLHVGMHRFLPTLLRIEGFRVGQIPVNHRPRHSGQSKYGIWDRAWRSFIDLLAVRWMKSRRLDYEVVHREH